MAASSPEIQRAGAGSGPLAAKPPGNARRLDALVAVAAVLVVAGAILNLSQHPSGVALLPAVIALVTLAALVTLWFGLQSLRRILDPAAKLLCRADPEPQELYLAVECLRMRECAVVGGTRSLNLEGNAPVGVDRRPPRTRHVGCRRTCLVGGDGR